MTASNELARLPFRDMPGTGALGRLASGRGRWGFGPARPLTDAALLRDHEDASRWPLVVLIAAVAMIAVAALGLAGAGRVLDASVLVGFVVCVIAVVASSARRRRLDRAEAIAAALALPDSLPFPHTGWRAYLASDEPRMIVVTATPIDVRAVAAAAARIDWRIVVEPLADDAVRIALPSSAPAFAQRVFARVLVPLHDSAGIAMLKMGAA